MGNNVRGPRTKCVQGGDGKAQGGTAAYHERQRYERTDEGRVTDDGGGTSSGGAAVGGRRGAAMVCRLPARRWRPRD